MINKNQGYKNRSAMLFLAFSLLFLSTAVNAGRFTLNVVDQAGNPVSGFKWLLQEDTTFAVDPANPSTNPDELLSMGFHASNHPPARKGSDGSGLSGNTDAASALISNVPYSAPKSRYYVSVLPYAGYSISGAQVEITQSGAVGGTAGESPPVTVVVQKEPVPTAQISIYLFHDNSPINGTPDLPEETDPGVGQPGHVDWTQFQLFLEEPAGRYGQNGGQVIQDVFGNPLGTTYQHGCDANGQPDADPNTFYGCFDANGDPIVIALGDGTMRPDENGFLTVKNVAPGKYGIIIIPPSPSTDPGWIQTSTIEGTKVIDAWVKANEPPVFVEFGLPGPHVFVGFIKSSADGGFPPLSAGAGQQVATISGNITDMHMSRSPSFQFYSGRPLPQCWVGLNESTPGGLGRGLFAAPCGANSDFNIPNVPPGSYQLVIWDKPLDAVIAAQPFTVDDTGGTCNGGASCNFGEVPVFNWFARLNTAVFNDINQNGFWDTNETGIGPESQSVSLRWRDGTMYQSFPTDGEGFAPFDEAFPFFHWLVAEVSFANKKPTGATFVVDAGGEIPADNGWAMPSMDELTPQAQACTPAQSTNPDDPDFGCTVGDPIVNPNTLNNLSRTETGQVLTTAFQGFLGQTSILQFGKTDYVNFTAPDFTTVPPTLPAFVGENGGVSGIVYYATVRAENDPQFAAAETWEPGIPRVQINLYADGDIDCFPQGDFPNSDCDIDWNGNGQLEADDAVIDDVNPSDAPATLADIDNYPLGNFPGVEDVDRNSNGTFDYGDAIAITWSDSWDDDLPTGCQGQNLIDFDQDGTITAEENSRCFDGLRSFNQVRPGVFDGGFAFNNYETSRLPAAIQTKLTAFYASRQSLANLPAEWILPADYIVEAATPAGYKLVKEEHKNVDFGAQYIPSAQAIAAVCVGDIHPVPALLAMATKDGSGDAAQIIPGLDPAEVAAPFATEQRPLCDRKEVSLSGAQNAGVEFFLMTDVPIASNATGVMLNDLANEFNPNSPAFGEKFAPPNAPVAFYDAEGNEVSRVYADTYGRYNAVLPSTYTANLPQPSGQSPNMLQSCMNDAGPIANPAYDPALDTDGDNIDDNGNAATMLDPYFNKQFSQFCYTMQYMPGATVYLDTPVEPIAAFAGPGNFPVDCEQPTLIPMIRYVKRRNTNIGPFALPGQQIRIQAMGNNVQVPNPEWDGVDLANKYVSRNYNFGSNPLAKLVAEDGTEIAMTVVNGNGNRIFAEVPAVAPGDYQVVVTRVGGVPAPIDSPIGVTLTVGTLLGTNEVGMRPNGQAYNVWSVPGDFATIQEAIGDPTKGQIGVPAGDMILVEPGIYDEMVIMWKPVKLQGWGAGAVTINARQSPTEKIVQWRALARKLDDDASIDRLMGQTLAPLGFPALAEALFPTEQGAGIFVVGKRTGANRFGAPANRGARIDGFTIVGASQGGGIVVNGFNQFLNIGNNIVTTNAGIYGGGIRIGHPNISHEIAAESDYNLGGVDQNELGALVYDDAVNDRIRIHHNHITQNGNSNGTGGGISLNVGADAYKVQENWICGNFGKGNGGGISHFGRSNGGLIEDNHIIFNEVFNQQVGTAPSGGGIFIGGQPPLMVANETGLLLSSGTGHVTVNSNIIRGNSAGAGDGSGIRIDTVNGLDVDRSLGARGPWYDVFVLNNMIDNNVAGVAGAISVSDSLQAVIRNNTIANNDSTATGSQAFDIANPNISIPQPAGVISRLHGPTMAQLVNINETAGDVFIDPATLRDPDGSLFSDLLLRDNIVYHNRSFFWLNFDNPATAVSETGLFPATDTCLASVPADLTTFNTATCNGDLINIEGYSNDLAVMNGNIETTNVLDARFSLLQTGELVQVPGSNTFITGDPGFVNGYFNQRRDSFLFPEFTTLATAGAFDEGGNFIQVAFGPISLTELDSNPNNAEGPLFDYHLTAASAAINNGGNVGASSRIGVDIDNQARPNGRLNDIGADEAI